MKKQTVTFTTPLVPDKSFNSPRSAKRAARRVIQRTQATIKRDVMKALKKKGIDPKTLNISFKESPNAPSGSRDGVRRDEGVVAGGSVAGQPLVAVRDAAVSDAQSGVGSRQVNEQVK